MSNEVRNKGGRPKKQIPETISALLQSPDHSKIIILIDLFQKMTYPSIYKIFGKKHNDTPLKKQYRQTKKIILASKEKEECPIYKTEKQNTYHVITLAKTKPNHLNETRTKTRMAHSLTLKSTPIELYFQDKPTPQNINKQKIIDLTTIKYTEWKQNYANLKPFLADAMQVMVDNLTFETKKPAGEKILKEALEKFTQNFEGINQIQDKQLLERNNALLNDLESGKFVISDLIEQFLFVLLIEDLLIENKAKNSINEINRMLEKYGVKNEAIERIDKLESELEKEIKDTTNTIKEKNNLIPQIQTEKPRLTKEEQKYIYSLLGKKNFAVNTVSTALEIDADQQAIIEEREKVTANFFDLIFKITEEAQKDPEASKRLAELAFPTYGEMENEIKQVKNKQKSINTKK